MSVVDRGGSAGRSEDEGVIVEGESERGEKEKCRGRLRCLLEIHIAADYCAMCKQQKKKSTSRTIQSKEYIVVLE
jgi:hypothetical protein